MSYEALEQKFRSLPQQSFEEVSIFFDFILYKFNEKISHKEKPSFERPLGRYEGGFYLASDFDATPDCFKGYV